MLLPLVVLIQGVRVNNTVIQRPHAITLSIKQCSPHPQMLSIEEPLGRQLPFAYSQNQLPACFLLLLAKMACDRAHKEGSMFDGIVRAW